MMQPIAPFTAYIDDSSSSEDDQILMLAGYAQTAQVWAAFSDDWDKVLKEKPAIRYCHMTEAEVSKVNSEVGMSNKETANWLRRRTS
jgi:hypothetical protein